MSDLKRKALLQELARRQESLATADMFNFEDYCFDKQVEFFRGDGPRFRVACCSRRSGKTIGIAADLVDKCLKNPGHKALYITTSKQQARNIIWGDLVSILEAFHIPCEFDNTRLHVKFPNGSQILIDGANDRAQIEKFRGLKLGDIYLDECQSFRNYINELVNEVLTPCLRDLRGNLYMTGTPGPVKAGYFYDCTQNANWHSFSWTAFENPHMHDPPQRDLEETLAEEREMKGISQDDPSYIRETYGKWIDDPNALVYKFNTEKNVVSELPDDLTYVFGIDIGYNDADAIAVLGYSEETDKVYLVEEHLERKQDITSLVNAIKRLQAIYKPVKMVMDAGALGKKIQEEILNRHQLNILAAEKTRKVEFIELMNDDLRQSKLVAKPGTIFEEDCFKVEWDKESFVRNPERPKVSHTFHSDICDAVLYAWRECYHYLYEPREEEAKPGTDKWMDEMEAREARDMELKQNDPDMYDLEMNLRDLDNLASDLDW